MVHLKNIKACVLGLGEVGLPTAKYIANKGVEVFGYDLKPEAIEKAKKSGILKASTNWQEIPKADVYIICVYAGLKDGKPDFSSIFDVCEKINEKVFSSSSQASCLVSIESTLIPGVARKLYEEIFKRHVRLIHVPHRYWAGDPVRHGVKQRRVMGGIDEESLKLGLNFYNKVLKIPLHIALPIEVAEMSKISENTYRYIQIAFAEELKMICEELGLKFEEVRKACNTKWNIEIPEARDGIKGHCLSKDAKYFASLKRAEIVVSAMHVDENYQKWLHQKSLGPYKPLR
jgi:UDP-N-acetyl-D-mannosaminuronic acid dehydrogenase